MGIDLTSESGPELRMSTLHWDWCQRLAESHGWKPAGTLPPDGYKAETWCATYNSNDGQRVAADDAMALAEALERGLETAARIRRNENVEAAPSGRFGKEFDRWARIPKFEDEERRVREVAAFCRCGAFRIF